MSLLGVSRALCVGMRMHRGAPGRTVLLLATVGAVLVGLLAMHTLSSTPAGHSEMMSSMPAGVTTPGDVLSAMAADVTVDCPGICDPGHSMAGMACVLALLFSALLLTIAASRRWSMFAAVVLARWPAILAVVVAAILPPDLNALAISRR